MKLPQCHSVVLIISSLCLFSSISLSQGFHYYHLSQPSESYSSDPDPYQSSPNPYPASSQNPYITKPPETPSSYYPSSDSSYLPPSSADASNPYASAASSPSPYSPVPDYGSSLAYYSSMYSYLQPQPQDSQYYSSTPVYMTGSYPPTSQSQYPSSTDAYQYTAESSPYYSPPPSMSPYPSTYSPYLSPSVETSYPNPYASPYAYFPYNPASYFPPPQETASYTSPPPDYSAGSYSPPTSSSPYSYESAESPPTYYPRAYAQPYQTYQPPNTQYAPPPSYQEEVYGGDYFHGREIVDPKGRYMLEWIVDYAGKTITFNVTIKAAKCWVGLGLSKDGTMKNADIIIAGIKGYGAEPYIGDYFSDGERRLYSDAKSNWVLVYGEILNGNTHLQISRDLDTCDPYDYPITEDLVSIIWAYGETENYDYHFDKRGSFKVYLLDPILRTYESPLSTWRISKSMVLPKRKTSNWCSVHKAPHMSHMGHIVEISPYFADQLSMNHTHIIILWKCVAPPGKTAREIFEPLLDYPGEECFFPEQRNIPTQYCMNVYHKWAIGGKPYVLPYDVGFPIGESRDEYWILESNHYNPEEQPLPLDCGLDVKYTHKVRKHDGEMLVIGYHLFGTFLIPPISTNFEVYGICSSDCTQAMIPKEGIEIVSITLHADYSARKMKLKHLRNGTELPWIMKDDNFDTTFQQWRNLYKPRTILPGDQMIMECEYDNTAAGGTVLSGFQLTEEMCVADIVINKRIPYFACFGQIDDKLLMKMIGVSEYERSTGSGERVVTSPRALKGKAVAEVSDSVDWTKARRHKIQEITIYAPQNGTCPQIMIPTDNDTTDREDVNTVVNYPYNAYKYSPERYCRDTFTNFYKHPYSSEGNGGNYPQGSQQYSSNY